MNTQRKILIFVHTIYSFMVRTRFIQHMIYKSKYGISRTLGCHDFRNFITLLREIRNYCQVCH